MRAVHVLGIAHSGTTIIDRILSCFPKVIGLGEVEGIWPQRVSGRLDGSKRCSCGLVPSECPYWANVLAYPCGSAEEQFRQAATEAARQGYGWLIDTSKAMAGDAEYLDLAAAGTVERVCVLRVIRDPRGWVSSMMRRSEIDAADEEGARRLFQRWLILSLVLDRRCPRPNWDWSYVWYDKLVLDRQEATLAALIGLPSIEGEIDLSKANQHALAGNSFKSLGRSKIRYDSRWLDSRLLDDLYADLPHVRHYYHTVKQLHLVSGRSLTGVPQPIDLRRLLKGVMEGRPLSECDKLNTELSVAIVDGPIDAKPAFQGKRRRKQRQRAALRIP